MKYLRAVACMGLTVGAVLEGRLANMSASQADRVQRVIAQARQVAKKTGG